MTPLSHGPLSQGMVSLLTDADGWTAWHGGQPVLAGHVEVEIRRRDGMVQKTRVDESDCWVWGVMGSASYDIIAFRLVEEAAGESGSSAIEADTHRAAEGAVVAPPVAWACKTCNSPRAVDPCPKCGTPLTKPADGWEWPALPDISRISEMAREVGYAVGVHGTLERDLDLIAVPWVAEAVGPLELAQHIASGLGGEVVDYERQDKPCGRWSCNIHTPDWTKMIDLSVMPPAPQPGSSYLMIRTALEGPSPGMNEGEAGENAPSLVDQLRSLSALEPGWYANVGKRTAERCCAAMREAADEIERLLSPPSLVDQEGVRERLARIIDPEAWADLARVQAAGGPWFYGYSGQKALDASLAKADRCLQALAVMSPRIEQKP